MGEKKPTIEQKSSFSAKTKEGQDVEFVSTIKYYIDPTGDVRIVAPGSGKGSAAPSEESATDMVGANPEQAIQVLEDSEKSASTDSSSKSSSMNKNESSETRSTHDAKEHKKAQSEFQSDGGSKFPSHGDADKRTKGDCPPKQFIPDPCKAVDDLTQTIKGFFSWSSSRSCAPCPNCDNPGKNVSNFTATPEPKQLVTDGELGQDKRQPGDGKTEEEIT